MSTTEFFDFEAVLYIAEPAWYILQPTVMLHAEAATVENSSGIATPGTY
jgi:hypothetical protein